MRSNWTHRTTVSSGAIRELLIGEARLVLELRTVHTALGLADGNLVLHKGHPLVNTAIWAGTVTGA